jgi:hypothetical protein
MPTAPGIPTGRAARRQPIDADPVVDRPNVDASLNSQFEDRKNDSRKVAKIATMDENSIDKEIVDAAIAVHREHGPGRLETLYEASTDDAPGPADRGTSLIQDASNMCAV